MAHRAKSVRGWLGVLVFLVAACTTPTAAPATATPVSTRTPAAPATVFSTATPVLPTSTPIPPSATPAPPTNTPAAFGDHATVIRDLPFCAYPGLRLDLFFPHERLRTPTPALIFFHAGGGDKRQVRPPEFNAALARGYVVVSANFREPPFYPLPLAFEDAKCAVRFLRAHAADYHLDPDRLGAWGCSAGGWLAAMLGVTAVADQLEGDGGYLDQSSRVQAVVFMDGIANARSNYADALDEGLSILGITAWSDPRVEQFSPITYATADDAPFLLFGSSNNPHWYNQALELHGALQAAGVASEVVEVHGNHCWAAASDPTPADIAARLVAYFDEKLP